MDSDPSPSTIDAADVIARIAAMLQERKSFVLSTHRDPDGDGLGAEAALRAALRQLGKRVRVINDEPVPAGYQFLPGSAAFETFDPDVHPARIARADVVVLLDAGSPGRAGRLAPTLAAFPGERIVIDHHPGAGWAGLELIVPEAGSTTELLLRVLDRLPVRITPRMADALYCGLVTDTLAFRASQTTAAAHRVAARLLDLGASVERVHDAFFGSWPLGRLQLLGQFLAEVESALDGRLAWGVVRREMLSGRGLTSADVEGFVEEILRLNRVEIAMLFLEEEGTVRVSLRSRGGRRVDQLAQRLGGGGHRHAAGTRLPGGLDEVVPRCLNEATREIEGTAGRRARNPAAGAA